MSIERLAAAQRLVAKELAVCDYEEAMENKTRLKEWISNRGSIESVSKSILAQNEDRDLQLSLEQRVSYDINENMDDLHGSVNKFDVNSTTEVIELNSRGEISKSIIRKEDAHTVFSSNESALKNSASISSFIRKKPRPLSKSLSKQGSQSSLPATLQQKKSVTIFDRLNTPKKSNISNKNNGKKSSNSPIAKPNFQITNITETVSATKSGLTYKNVRKTDVLKELQLREHDKRLMSLYNTEVSRMEKNRKPSRPSKSISSAVPSTPSTPIKLRKQVESLEEFIKTKEAAEEVKMEVKKQWIRENILKLKNRLEVNLASNNSEAIDQSHQEMQFEEENKEHNKCDSYIKEKADDFGAFSDPFPAMSVVENEPLTSKAEEISSILKWADTDISLVSSSSFGEVELEENIPEVAFPSKMMTNAESQIVEETTKLMVIGSKPDQVGDSPYHSENDFISEAKESISSDLVLNTSATQEPIQQRTTPLTTLQESLEAIQEINSEKVQSNLILESQNIQSVTQLPENAIVLPSILVDSPKIETRNVAVEVNTIETKEMATITSQLFNECSISVQPDKHNELDDNPFQIQDIFSKPKLNQQQIERIFMARDRQLLYSKSCYSPYLQGKDPSSILKEFSMLTYAIRKISSAMSKQAIDMVVLEMNEFVDDLVDKMVKAELGM